LVYISGGTNWCFFSFSSWSWLFFDLLFGFCFSSLTLFNSCFLLDCFFSWSGFLCWGFRFWFWCFWSCLLLWGCFFWSRCRFFCSGFFLKCRFWFWFFFFYSSLFCFWLCLFSFGSSRLLFCWCFSGWLLLYGSSLFLSWGFFLSWSCFLCWCFSSIFNFNLCGSFFGRCIIFLFDTTFCLCQNLWFTSEIHMN